MGAGTGALNPKEVSMPGLKDRVGISRSGGNNWHPRQRHCLSIGRRSHRYAAIGW